MPTYPKVDGFKTNSPIGFADLELFLGTVSDTTLILIEANTPPRYSPDYEIEPGVLGLARKTLKEKTLAIKVTSANVLILLDYNCNGIFDDSKTISIGNSKLNNRVGELTFSFPPSDFVEGLALMRIFVAAKPISEADLLQASKDNNQAKKDIQVIDIKIKYVETLPPVKSSP